MQRNKLSEEIKIEILFRYRQLGPQWTKIGSLLSVNPQAVRSFIKSYNNHGTITPKRGRPVEINEPIIDGVIGAVEEDPEMSLRDLHDLFNISTTSARKILNEDNIKYFQKIPIPPLQPYHRRARIAFVSRFINLSYSNMPIIIFTDESTVEVNLNGGGIWRRRGEYPPGSFYEKVSHPVSCMIWGGIGPRGFRTSLFKINGTVTAESYIHMLVSNMIPQQIFNQFGNAYFLQQDNAKPHIARRIRPILNAMFPRRIDWPAKSPDLSPIEQVWDYLKGRIAGVKFADADQLFKRLQQEWNTIPDEVLHNIYSSFLARCKVCAQIEGRNLNGHWKHVTKIHNTYRTQLRYRYIMLPNQTFQLIAEEY